MKRVLSLAKALSAMPHVPVVGFPQRLRELRQQRDLTQQELAKRANIHYTHIGRYESSKSMPAADTLRRIAEALGTTVDYLMDGATQDSAKARLNSRALLDRFQEVEKLPDDQQIVILQLMDAFLAMHQLKAYASKHAG
jgi:transcriptional regulator with XRE-family HTH domain